MRFPAEWLQKLKETVSLVEIVSENVELKKSGNSRFMGRCPFHGDRTPSFSVTQSNYYCFGCKVHGDVIEFVKELHGLSFEEACEDLAEKVGLALPQDTQTSEEERAQYARRAVLQKAARLNHFAALKFYHQNLVGGSTTGANSPNFQEARDYLKKRGISPQTIQNFQIGVSAGPDGLAQFLAAAKAPLEIAREFGLIRPSLKGPGDYDVFRERLVFPLIDVRGRVCGFGGRILPSYDKGESAKYINSSDSELYNKSKFLYGLFQGKRAIREQDTAIVVEGYFDVVGMHQSGFENTVAVGGTSLTEDQLKTLTRLCKRIILFFDRDDAGIKATLKSVETALKMGIVIYGLPYDSKLDPDEFLLSGKIEDAKARMEKMIDQAYPLIDTMIEKQMKSSEGNVEKRTQAIKKIITWLEAFSDPVGRTLRVDYLLKKWSVPPAALGALALNSQGHNIRPQGRPAASAPGPAPSKRPKLNALDRELLQFFMQFEQFGPQFLEARKQMPENVTLPVLFQDTEVRAWVERIQADPSGFSKLKMAPESLMDDSISQELRAVMLEGLLRDPVAGQEAQLNSLIKEGVKRIWAQLSQEIKKKMAAAEISQDMKSLEELSKQFLDLQKKLKEFEDPYVIG